MFSLSVRQTVRIVIISFILLPFVQVEAIERSKRTASECSLQSLASRPGQIACAEIVGGGEPRVEPTRIVERHVMFYKPWYAKSKNGLVEAAEATISGVYHPHRHVEEYEFSLPMDWAADPFRDRSWRARLQSLNIIDPLLLQYEEASEERYLAAALEIVLDWYQYHVVDGRDASMAWSNGPVGIRSAKIGWLYSQLISHEPSFYSESDIQHLAELALVHIEKVLSGEVELRMTNHGLFQINGLVVLCRAFEFRGLCDEVDDFVAVNLPRIIRAQYSPSGVHLEHSPNYHSFATNKLAFFEESGLYSEFSVIRETRALALRTMYWLVDPSGDMWAVGDTFASSPRDTVVPSDRACESVGAFDPVCVQIWSEDGYVSVRSPAEVAPERASGLFVQGAFHSNVHKHLDDLSFELYERGERILIDSGPIGYKVSPMRRYVLSTRAHNTIEIDNNSFSRDMEYVYGSAVKSVGNLGDHIRIQGEVFHPELGATHSRDFFYNPSRWLVIRDTVKAPESRKFVQWFHLAPSAEFVSREGSEVVFETDRGQVIIYGDPECPSTLVKGERKPRIQGWYSPSSGKVEPNYALGYVCALDEEGAKTIVTVIALDDAAHGSAAEFAAGLQ